MLETAINNEINRFDPNSTQEKNRPDLNTFNIKIKSDEWQGTLGDKMYELEALALEMSIHGFVQNFGVDASTRSGGKRKRHKVEREDPEFTTYYRSSHEFHVPKTNFIADAIEKSGAVPYVLGEITRIRGERVFLGMSSYFNEAVRRHVK